MKKVLVIYNRFKIDSNPFHEIKISLRQPQPYFKSMSFHFIESFEKIRYYCVFPVPQ